MIVKSFSLGSLGANCYYVADDETAVLVDPGFYDDPLYFAEKYGINVLFHVQDTSYSVMSKNEDYIKQCFSAEDIEATRVSVAVRVSEQM